jgi:antirestriction protein ArdC
MSVYEIITERIVAALESGVAPWRKPWTTAMPCNLISQKEYRGVNVWLTSMQGFESKYWLTFNQCNKLGGKIKKGEKGTPITFWSVGKESLNPKTGKVSKPFMLKYFTVFNLTQTEGIDLPRAVFAASKVSEFDANAKADALIAGMPKPPSYEKSDAAWYRPRTDAIGMPARTSFHTPSAYYATQFHEMAHSTGHATRLGRFDGTEAPQGFGSESYSKEELIAELTSSFLCGLAGIETETLPASASYLASWIKVLKGDSKLIVGACSAAQKASDYIANVSLATDTESITEAA